MPRFNGQNKKRIDPRYFYDELLEKKDPLDQGHYKGLEKAKRKTNEAHVEEVTKALKEDQSKCPRNTRQGKALARTALREAADEDKFGQMDVMNKYCISDTKRKGRRTLVVFQNGIRVVV